MTVSVGTPHARTTGATCQGLALGRAWLPALWATWTSACCFARRPPAASSGALTLLMAFAMFSTAVRALVTALKTPACQGKRSVTSTVRMTKRGQ